MEKKKSSRKLKPEKGSGAKERDGLLTQEHVLPENLQELTEWANSVQSVTAIDKLNSIIKYSEGVLEKEEYEELGPGHLAGRAKFYAALALKKNEEEDHLKALQAAMSAVGMINKLEFSLHFERPAALGVGVYKDNRSNIRKRWSADEARDEVSGIVSSLASRKDELGDPETPSNLWPLLFSELDYLGIRVKEGDTKASTNSESIRDCYYQIDGLEAPYRYDAFRQTINRLRK